MLFAEYSPVCYVHEIAPSRERLYMVYRKVLLSTTYFAALADDKSTTFLPIGPGVFGDRKTFPLALFALVPVFTPITPFLIVTRGTGLSTGWSFATRTIL